jgi:exodeoxyribonuclease VII small subunit
MSKKNKSFETSLKRLQEISELLESDVVTLEESIKLYEEGIKLSKECYSTLEKAELKVDELNSELEDEQNKS